MPESREQTVYGEKSVAAEIDRRRNVRSHVVASAQVIDLNSGSTFSTRISDVSRGGCFVDALNPLPIGSRVRLTLQGSGTAFETAGVVIYTQQRLGMGIAFEAMSPEQLSAFEEWLSRLDTRSETPAVMSPAPSAPQIPASDQDVVARLVYLLLGKGILTETEARALLHGPWL